MPPVAEVPVIPAAVVPPVAAPVVPVPEQSEMAKMRAKLTPPIVKPEPVAKAPVVDKEVPPAKEAAVPTPKVETPAAKTTEADEFLKTASPKTQERFVKLANERAEALFQERLKTTKLLTPDVEEKLTLAERRAQEMETELRQSNIERSPEYKAKFVEQPKAIRTKLGEYAKTWNIPEESLINAVEGGRENRRQLSEVLSSIDEIDRDDVRQLARDYWKIQEDRTQVLSDFDTAQKLLDQKRLNETKAAVEKLVSGRVEAFKSTVLPQMEKEYGAIFEGDEGTALKTTVIGHIEKLNGSNLETMAPADRAAMISCAFLAQPLLKTLAARNERIAELESKLAKEDGVTPTVGGRLSSAPPEEKPKGAFERMRETLGA
jgi:hypothetical protein